MDQPDPNQRTLENIALPKSAGSSQLRNGLILAFLSIIWGSSFILIKKGLVVYDPVQVACLRIGISALAFLPVLLVRFKKIDWSKWKYLLLVGITGSGVPAFLFSIAQTKINSSMAGILNSLTPLFTLLLGIFLFGAPLKWTKVLGVLIGLAGAAGLILFGNEGGMQGNIGYSLLIILATICYGTSVNTVGKYLNDIPSLIISAVSFSFVGLPAFFYLMTTDFFQLLAQQPGAWDALGYITILSLGGTVLATVIFFRLVQWTNPVFASTVAYLIPIVALIWGVFDGEQIGLLSLVGMGLILTGVYLSRN